MYIGQQRKNAILLVFGQNFELIQTLKLRQPAGFVFYLKHNIEKGENDEKRCRSLVF